MNQAFSHIAIIGCGLIGSSILHAINRYYQQNQQAKPRLHIIDNNPAHLAQAQELKLGDDYYADAAQGVQLADFIILASPVGAYASIATQIADHIQPSALISDVGSTKQTIIAQLRAILPAHCSFIAAHPIAGTENSGPSAGFANLFDGRYVIITPDNDTPDLQLQKLTEFWQNLGAMIEIMSAPRHDKVLAITSHLPHLIAYTIVGTARNLENELDSIENNGSTPDSRDVIRFSAGGFRDFTRIAASDPIMWRDVFLHNRDAVLELLANFRNDLDFLTKAIETSDSDALEKWFTDTRIIRRQIIEEKQAGQFIATENKQKK
ncbi:MAG: prephenate dehydrogenase/arogenate dehydrogenase family protein [Alphaproteobacteria bacterium]|nr:prephenate dehydrogenase/arogenate dehydrogenase family protein [Alphaproteobacteria bacterium]